MEIKISSLELYKIGQLKNILASTNIITLTIHCLKSSKRMTQCFDLAHLIFKDKKNAIFFLVKIILFVRVSERNENKTVRCER